METNLWIARDKDGDLYIFGNKPIKNGDVFVSDDYCEKIIIDMYPEITFENSPVELKTNIK